MRYYRVIPLIVIVLLAIGAVLYLKQQQREPSVIKQSIAIKGIGVIGDSQSDEYQADDARGYEYAPTTINWVEQLVKSRHLNFGTWQDWGDVRRTGFAYNWSRTGATTAEVLVNMQPEGLAAQIKDGQVNVAIVYIGANDFAPYNFTDGYLPIYNGTIHGDALAQKIDTVTTNIETIVSVIKRAGNVHVFLVTVPDWNVSIQMQVGFYDQTRRARVSDAVAAINKKLLVFAKQQAIPIIDINAFYRQQLSRAPLGSIAVGSEQITLLVPGDEPHHTMLSDAVHPGTIVNGLFASYVIHSINESLNTNLAPLTADEILSNAGL